MPETQGDKQIFSLYEVTRSIQKTIAERYKSSFWVKAEMNKLNHYSHSGHCYPELVEKREGKVIAQIKANLWKSDYQRINALFLKVTKEHIKDGISILFLASIHFDPSHGLCLRMLDIDPSYSLGELEREKQESIALLQSEGIFFTNKQLPLALLPQRIAVISVETSKGYADYLKVIEGNPWKYRIFNMLFPALLQGDKSVESILFQLARIKKVHKHFDAVAIIRGGGGDVGLSSYNNYQLAREISLFPIPVLTGIGHSTNETVAEMVSFKNAITPTELADFLLQRFHNFSKPVEDAAKFIKSFAEEHLSREHHRLNGTIKVFNLTTDNALSKQDSELRSISHKLNAKLLVLINNSRNALGTQSSILASGVKATFNRKNEALSRYNDLLRSSVESIREHEFQKLRQIEHSIKLLDPVNVLKRGFSITMDKNGGLIKSVNDLRQGQSIQTMLADGTIITEVKEINKESE